MAAFVVTPARAQRSAPQQEAPPAARELTIPDGTQVELRFAQEVVGRTIRVNPLLPPLGGVHEAQAGDTVRLVAAANVRIEGRVVIAKGAVGQATVTDVMPVVVYNKRPSEETGLFLRLDWIRGVNDREIPLRIFKKGRPGRFHAAVNLEHGGVVIHPAFEALPDSKNDSPADEKKKSWIPMGSRITAFVQGTIALDRSEVEQAQAQLLISTSTGMLTIYRTKDNHHSSAAVSCDDKQVAQIGEQQYIVLELAPGAHACQVSGEKALTIAVAAGEEYFLHLQPRMFGGWELKSVSASEGEDGIAGAQMMQ